MNWYSHKLIEHGRNILKIAWKTFLNTCITEKIAGIHLKYLNETKYSEATARYYNTNENDGHQQNEKKGDLTNDFYEGFSIDFKNI